MGCAASSSGKVSPEGAAATGHKRRASVGTDPNTGGPLSTAKKDLLQGIDSPWVKLLSVSQLLEIHQAFNRFDRDDSGEVDAKELKQVMKTLGMDATNEQIKEMIKSVDVDQSGMIEFEEFANMMARRFLIQDGQIELDQAFKLFDSDGSGYVSIEEMRTLLMAVGGEEALTEREMTALIKVADPNGDGRITYAEFRDMPCWGIPDMPDTMVSPRRQSRTGDQ